jgi:hypothetical protein
MAILSYKQRIKNKTHRPKIGLIIFLNIFDYNLTMKKVLPQCFIACLMFNGIAMEKPLNHSSTIVRHQGSHLKTEKSINNINNMFINGPSMESMENYFIETGLVAMDVINKIFLDGQWLKNEIASLNDSIQLEMFVKFLDTGRFSLCDFLLFWGLQKNCDGLLVMTKSFPLDLVLYFTWVSMFLIYRSNRFEIFQWCRNFWLTNLMCDIFLY